MSIYKIGDIAGRFGFYLSGISGRFGVYCADVVDPHAGTMDPSRRKLPPLVPHKRKVRDESFTFLRSSKPIRPPRPPPPPPPPPKLHKPKPVAPPPTAPTKPSKPAASSPAQPPANNNILLAGYMAYEYLNKGTLFGQPFDPAASPASPATSSAGSKTMRQPSSSSGSGNRDKGKAVELKPKPKPNPKPSEKKRIHEPQLVKNQRYADVSQLLKDGVHIPGIVNPSQLARFLNI